MEEHQKNLESSVSNGVFISNFLDTSFPNSWMMQSVYECRYYGGFGIQVAMFVAGPLSPSI